MRVIGVLDLAGGLAVHARGGRREGYVPVREVAGVAIPDGDALAVARAYVERLGITEIYVADLDAIARGKTQGRVIGALADLGARLWLDAGISAPAHARHALRLGAHRVVVGLETLSSYHALDRICGAVDPASVAFSLDLRAGEPIVAAGAAHAGASAESIAARAAAAGVPAIIVLDLSRVGMGSGPDLPMLARIRAAAPRVVLLAGGGVRDAADLERLAAVGCDGALVASALLSGDLGPPHAGGRG